MRNKYILLELNDKNEIRADVDITIESLNIYDITNINVKIDTGCPYTSIPAQKIGISKNKAQQMKEIDCKNPKVQKRVSYGVNDTIEQKQRAKEEFKNGNFSSIKEISFIHKGFEISFDDIKIHQNQVSVSYDRTGNILIGMDILSKMDIHIGKSKITNKTIMLACPYEMINNEYYKALNEHFGLSA